MTLFNWLADRRRDGDHEEQVRERDHDLRQARDDRVRRGDEKKPATRPDDHLIETDRNVARIATSSEVAPATGAEHVTAELRVAPRT